MNHALVSLKLVLDQLGVKPAIDTLDDRKRVQKTVYLAQAAGLNLGYSYGWYLKGPYSRKLTRDYFALDEAMSSPAKEPTELPPELVDIKLRRPVVDILEGIKPAFTPPENVDLDDASWLELLASLHYLHSERHLDDGRVEKVIAEEKRALHPYIDLGRRTLQDCGLL